VAVVPADVHVRSRQTAEWGRTVAEPDGADGALRDATVADVGWVVCTPTTRFDAEGIMWNYVRDRTCGAVPDFREPRDADDRRKCVSLADGADLADGKLLLLQSSDGAALPVVGGRPFPQ